MFSLSWLRGRGIIRARPTTDRRRATRSVALALMAVAALCQTGCRSGVFSPCGFVGRTTSRIMHPFRGGAGSGCFGASSGCCGSEIGSEVPMEYAGPIGVVPAAPVGVPVIQGGAVPSTVAPPIDSPTDLDPLPSAKSGPPPTSGRGSTGSIRRPSSYDAQRPAGASGRGASPVPTLVSTPASTARSTRDATRASAETIGASDNVLDHLPPLDLPAEVTGQGDSPPVAPAAVKPSPAASSSSTSPANDHLGGRSSREAETSLAAAAVTPEPPAAPAPEVAAKSGEAIGIDRFVAVDLKLAGGTIPSAVGLGWLVEKGYKTVLDLRDASRVDSAFIGEAASRGLRYVAFPVGLDKLTREQLERFSLELSLNDARPLYFFDEDGRRAGGLWYIRRILTDKVSPDIARREAEELGLTDAASWELVQNSIDRQVGARTAAAPGDAPKPAAAAPATPTAPAAAPPPPPATTAPPPVAQAMERTREIARASLGGDSGAWQPVAAMVLTGLTFPLAYFSRAVVPTMIARTRASLPGPARRSKSLPPASGA